MGTNAYQNYLDNEILGAEPLKLVVLLYRGAVESIILARRHLAQGDILARVKSINKAIEILAELAHSLDHQRGGELSAQLARLYDYCQRRLIEANARQIDAPLAEAERLMTTLLEAWTTIQEQQHLAEPAALLYQSAYAASAAGACSGEDFTSGKYATISYAY